MSVTCPPETLSRRGARWWAGVTCIVDAERLLVAACGNGSAAEVCLALAVYEEVCLLASPMQRRLALAWFRLRDVTAA